MTVRDKIKNFLQQNEGKRFKPKQIAIALNLNRISVRVQCQDLRYTNEADYENGTYCSVRSSRSPTL